MITTALHAMPSGGMTAHVRGCFSRYSTDAFAMAPHFLTLPYDQALPAKASLHGWPVPNGEFLPRALRRDDGRWLRSWQADAGARHLAYAADHAALVDAFTRLYEATGQSRWIAAARDTADALLDLFWDGDRAGLFTVGSDAEQLITRA